MITRNYAEDVNILSRLIRDCRLRFSETGDKKWLGCITQYHKAQGFALRRTRKFH